MKFSIDEKVLSSAIRKVSAAISNKTTIPILTGIRIDADQNGLVLTGMGTDFAIKASLDINDKKNKLDIAESGSIVVPAAFFRSVVNKLSGMLSIATNPKNFQVAISAQNSNFKINGLDASNYPHLPQVDKDKQTELSGKVLRALIHDTIFNAANSANRPILNGINLTANNGKLTAVATDSHRLARQVTNCDPKTKFSLNVPAKSMQTLMRLIDEKQNVIVASTDNQVLFTLPNTEFYSRLIEGRYPDIKQLIASIPKPTTAIVMSAKDLLNVVGRTSLVSHASRNNVVQLSIDPKKNIAEVSADSPDVGHTKNLMKPAIDGKKLAIRFNPDYMIDILKVLGDQSVAIGFTTPERPFILRLTHDKKHVFTEIVTPIRAF